jgi:hypothetical protein
VITAVRDFKTAVRFGKVGRCGSRAVSAGTKVSVEGLSPCGSPDRFWRIVLKKSAAQLFGMLQGVRRA